MRHLAKAFVAGAAFAGAAFSGGAGAFTAPPPASAAKDPSEIVVTADKQAMKRQVESFVHALTITRPNTNIERFEWSVCPVASGLTASQNAVVAARMRRVAQATGVPLAKKDCVPNVVVIVTPDKKAFIQSLLKRDPSYFDTLSRYQVKQLIRSPGPAAAWQVEGPMLSADGVELPEEKFTRDLSARVNQTTRPPSRITLAVRAHFTAAVVVVEAKALAGLTTTQLADYASMRVFARTDPDRLPEPAPPTILKVLDAPMGSEVPLTMSQWDFGFLKGLYAGNDTLYAGARRSAMGKVVERQVHSAAEPAPQP